MRIKQRKKNEIFELMGKLRTALIQLNIKRRAVKSSLNRTEKLAHKINILENKYINEFKESPRFWRELE